MQENNNNTFCQYAMQYGTLLGLLWCAMYASFIVGFTNIIYSILFLALNIASPFFAAHLATKYRRTQCEDQLSFTKAWGFLIIMYTCASLLSAVILVVYFRFLDNGYFVQTMQQMVNIMNENPNMADGISQDLNTSIEILANLSTKELVLNFLSSNLMNSAIITPIIALFIKKNPK